MNIAKIKVSNVCATADTCSKIPAGIIGATVTFEFDDHLWDGLTKTAIFRGCVTRDVPIESDTVVVPYETVAKEGYNLRIGVYGVDADNNVAVPTLWANIGMIHDSADPSGDVSTDPSLPVWAQLLDQIKSLDIPNSEDILEIVKNYLATNPLARIADVELLSEKWIGDTSPYYQVVNIRGVTENSQVDLTPSAEQLTIFHDKDLAFVTENDDGVVTVYAIGQKPTNDYTIQVTITEVKEYE